MEKWLRGALVRETERHFEMDKPIMNAKREPAVYNSGISVSNEE